MIEYERVPIERVVKNLIYEIAEKYGLEPELVETIIVDYDKVLSANVQRIIWVNLN